MKLPAEVESRLTDRQRYVLETLSGTDDLPDYEYFKDDADRCLEYLDGMYAVALGVEFESDNKPEFREPKYNLKTILDATTVKPATLRNWLTRKQVHLDADAVHDEEKWRVFSMRDAVHIALLHSLSSVGLGISDANQIAEKVMPGIEKLATSISGFAGPPEVYVWKADNEWKLGTALNSKVGKLSHNALPPIALSISPVALLKHVMSEVLGEKIMTSAEFRAQASDSE